MEYKHNCLDGIVCWQHRDQPFPHQTQVGWDCSGPGTPCDTPAHALPEKPVWPEANPGFKLGDPITPEMVLRTMQTIYDAGEMESIIAIALHPKRADGVRQWSEQMSTMDTLEAISILEYRKIAILMNTSVTPYLEDIQKWATTKLNTHLEWHRVMGEKTREHIESHRDALIELANSEEGKHIPPDIQRMMDAEVDFMEQMDHLKEGGQDLTYE